METHREITIIENRFGWYDVPAINCWSAPTIDSAKAAVDRSWLFKRDTPENAETFGWDRFDDWCNDNQIGIETVTWQRYWDCWLTAFISASN